MNEGQAPEVGSPANEEVLRELAQTIELSQGEFALLLGRCNYGQARSRLVRRLQGLCAVEICTIELDAGVKTLYSAIAAAVGEAQPQAVMVLGLESVRAIEPLLHSANQMREEFRKHFAFPLVLWVNDDAIRALIRFVPDFKSWATTFNFAIAPEELGECLRQSAAAVLKAVVGAGAFVSNREVLGSRHGEIQLALTDLEKCAVSLSPELEAKRDFLLGRDDYARQGVEASTPLSFNPALRQAQWPRSRRVEAALGRYRRSLAFWREVSFDSPASSLWEGLTPSQQALLWQGILLFHVGWCHGREAEAAEAAFREGLACFEQAQCPEWVARFVGHLGEVLRCLGRWEELEALAREAMPLHREVGFESQLARDCGFLAEVARQRGQWQVVRERAEEALAVLHGAESSTSLGLNAELRQAQLPQSRSIEGERSQPGAYALLLAQALQHLDRPQEAIRCLEGAKGQMLPQSEPKLYIHLLEELRSLYFAQKQYREAFRVKQRQREVELQFRLRAFIGAGQLQPQFEPDRPQQRLAQAFAASGRQQDVDYLVKTRISLPQYKLTVLYGPSGVGKSSLVRAGLVPALRERAIADRMALPVTVGLYADWVKELGRQLGTALVANGGVPMAESLESLAAIREQLQANAERHWLTVLVFDQFEEFFFACSEPQERREFYRFLQACLKGIELPFVKVVLSLREDYLHNLLEFEQFADREGFESDILRKEQRHYLGDFSPEAARSVIEQLTERAQFPMESGLVEVLVRDLANAWGKVRPIELQVVGAQLQADGIKTLAQYRQLGENPKAVLATRWLEMVVKDCGEENEEAAWQVLAALTDDKGRRPLRTREELGLGAGEQRGRGAGEQRGRGAISSIQNPKSKIQNPKSQFPLSYKSSSAPV